ELVEADHAHVAAARERALLVEHVGHPPAHAGGEVAPGGPEHDHPSARHVLAAVVAHALHDGPGAGVAHGEALAGQSAEERAPGGGAVEHRVAHDHVVLGCEVWRPPTPRAY